LFGELVQFERSSGILLHISSLPGEHGIGDFGKNAFEFIDFLAAAKQKLWQICPLGPAGYGNSPYSSYSAFAGNPLFIDITKFAKTINPKFNFEKVDFEKVKTFKDNILRETFTNFIPHEDFQIFCKTEAFWLDDFALFMALKKHFNFHAWNRWPKPIKLRKIEAIEKYSKLLENEILYQKHLQFIFFFQWQKVKNYANLKGIKIIGDIPIYVGADSADAWSNPQNFLFDQEMNPTEVAGVPPDGFSKDGQLWGNPLYNWKYLENHGFKWWINRIEMMLRMYDLVRIDHFIGLENYWAIPFGNKTAQNGHWKKAAGRKMFETLQKKMGKLPIIAEDLGVLTKDVEKLRDDFEFPGMKVLQFAFYDGMNGTFLPHHTTENFVVYTGTHDNETTKGWYKNLPKKPKTFLHNYLNFDGKNICWKLMETAWKSKAVMTIAPLQDFLELDNYARFNSPGTTKNNWEWRVKKEQLTKNLAKKIKEMTIRNHRAYLKI
jgi:4-alpha-glucanotransferase